MYHEILYFITTVYFMDNIIVIIVGKAIKNLRE